MYPKASQVQKLEKYVQEIILDWYFHSKLKSSDSQLYSAVFWMYFFSFQLIAIFCARILVQKSSLPEFSAQDNPAAFDTSILTR